MITKIQYPGPLPLIVTEQFIGEAVPAAGVLSHKRHGKPQHVLYAHSVNPPYVLRKIRKFSRLRSPVPAECVSAVIIPGLPAVVHDDCIKSHFCRSRGFLLDNRCVNILMPGIPERVHRLSGFFRHFHDRGHPIFPPLSHLIQRIPVWNIFL